MRRVASQQCTVQQRPAAPADLRRRHRFPMRSIMSADRLIRAELLTGGGESINFACVRVRSVSAADYDTQISPLHAEFRFYAVTGVTHVNGLCDNVIIWNVDKENYGSHLFLFGFEFTRLGTI